MQTQPTFTCVICEGTFPLVRDESWSEEKAQAELAAQFPGFSPEDCEQVCDDCYKQFNTDRQN